MSTQTPQTEADVRISELEEIYRAHVREIKRLWTERDHYKALCEELKEALRFYAAGDHLGHVNGHLYADDSGEIARAALKKARALTDIKYRSKEPE